MVLFALFYHDMIYNSLKSDNEERSADFARERLTSLNISSKEIEICSEIILSTKNHTFSSNSDINYFTDADLSVLGADWQEYEHYFKNVRKEYSFYPSFLYHRGRKKVLKHFLSIDRIYKTEYFYEKLENQARQNIQKEMDWLNN